MSSNVKIERLDEIEITELGEGPHWDAEKQCLYFIDIFGKSIHRYVPATKKHTKAVIGTNHVSIIIPVKDEKDKFVVSIGRELAIVTWNGETSNVSHVEKIYEVENDPETIDNRFNDGKCDPTGRLWVGKCKNNEIVRKLLGLLFKISLFFHFRYYGRGARQWSSKKRKRWPLFIPKQQSKKAYKQSWYF
nr:unnamed protein product [Callosobruchus analis]